MIFRRVDPDCVIVTVLSMGGVGTWTMAMAYPDRFSTIAPVCGVTNPADAARLTKLPVCKNLRRAPLHDKVLKCHRNPRMIPGCQSLETLTTRGRRCSTRPSGWLFALGLLI